MLCLNFEIGRSYPDFVRENWGDILEVLIVVGLMHVMNRRVHFYVYSIFFGFAVFGKTIIS